MSPNRKPAPPDDSGIGWLVGSVAVGLLFGIWAAIDNGIGIGLGVFAFTGVLAAMFFTRGGN